jgi:hypothetical protein
VNKAAPEIAAALSLIAAAPATKIATYDPAKVAIPRSTRVDTGAIISRAGRCLALRTFGAVPGKVGTPIWPVGSKRAGDTITLADGTPVRLGKKIAVAGRFATVGDQVTAEGCTGRPFYIQGAHPMFAWSDTGDLLDDADAAIIVRVNWLLAKDPQADGMLTTVDATIEEAINGKGYRRGQAIRLRLPSGIDADGQWQTSSHDPIYGATGGLKRKVADDRWLVFVNNDFYSEQARVRGGKPLPGYTGGSLFWRLDGQRIINERDMQMVADLPKLRSVAKQR